MNFRITTLFFALLLTMLWVFGLMIAHKKSSGDQDAIMKTLQSADAKNIDKVTIKRTGTDALDAEFVQEFDKWYYQEGKQKVRIDGFRVDNIIKQIKSAKHDETTDVTKDAANYGLKDPKVVITLHGKYKDEPKTWEFALGNESAGNSYVKTNERDGKIFAVPRKSIEGLFFKDANYLRSKRIFDFIEPGVDLILAKKGDKELELSRDKGNRWTFLKPKEYGFAGTIAEPEEPKDPHKKEFTPPPVTGGVKGLLNNIMAVRVEDEGDFVSLGKPAADFGVEKGKEKMRIEIASTHEGKKATELLLIGDEVEANKTKYYYARLDSDDGIMKIAAKYLDPIIDAIKDPGKIRSLNVAPFERKQAEIDAIVLKQGKAETQFFLEGEKEEMKFKMPQSSQQWAMIIAGKKEKASDETAVDALINLVIGKNAIIEFHDGTEAELKKLDAKWGLENPAAEIALYSNSIDKDKKEEKKDEAKKDDKKDEKKEPLPTLKKDAKAEITLAIGTVEKDIVHVRRTLKDGTVTRFTMKKEIAEKALPPEGIELAYLDTAVPTFSSADVAAIKLLRSTDKGVPLELVHRDIDGKLFWYIKDSVDPTGYKLADLANVEMLVGGLANLPVKKWLKKFDEKADADKLKNPVVRAEITLKKTGNFAAAAIGAFGIPQSLLSATCGAILQRELEKGETITIEIGKETDADKEKAAFATHSGSKLFFLVPSRVVKDIKEVELRDRSAIAYTQVEIMAMLKANAAINPIGQLMFASPYFTGTVQDIDPKTVTKVRLSVRTPFELRKFSFERIAKKEDAKVPEKSKDAAKDDKAKEKEKEKEPQYTWIDKSAGLDEFNLDPDKVAELVKNFSKLHTDRFAAIAGGPRDEQKLDPKDATIKLELDTVDGRTVTLLVGANYQQYGHFAASSLWTGADGKMAAVFFLPRSLVNPLLGGAGYFARERSAAN